MSIKKIIAVVLFCLLIIAVGVGASIYFHVFSLENFLRVSSEISQSCTKINDTEARIRCCDLQSSTKGETDLLPKIKDECYYSAVQQIDCDLKQEATEERLDLNKKITFDSYQFYLSSCNKIQNLVWRKECKDIIGQKQACLIKNPENCLAGDFFCSGVLSGNKEECFKSSDIKTKNLCLLTIISVFKKADFSLCSSLQYDVTLGKSSEEFDSDAGRCYGMVAALKKDRVYCLDLLTTTTAQNSCLAAFKKYY